MFHDVIKRKIQAAVIVAVCLCVIVPASAQRRGGQRGPFLQNQHQDRITVCWTLPRSHEAEVRLLDDDGKLLNTFKTAKANDSHEVVVKGLESDRLYQYEVQLKDSDKLIGKGQIKGVPSRGKPLKFVVWGDSREGDDIARQLSDQILKSGVGMCIHSGDLVNDGKRVDQWDRYVFRPGAAMMRSVVMWPVIGNHDTGMMPDKKEAVFKHFFSLPGNEAYFSFDYGDAHFIVLDSTSNLKEQAKWLEEDLAKAEYKWLFAAFHHPPFSGGNHESHIGIRTTILPILARHNVDMLIVGHDHTYMLSKPIRHVSEPKQKHPYVQLITGGGGAYPIDVDRDLRWFGDGLTAYHFIVIETEGDKLIGTMKDGRGKVLRRFTYSKSAKDAVPFELIELERRLSGINIKNTNLEGWPTGLVLEADAKSGVFEYLISNPLDSPLELTFDFSQVSAGLSFKKAKYTVQIDGKAEAELTVPFELTSVEKLYPMQGPTIALKSSLGEGKVTAQTPPLSVERRVIAHRTDQAITIDGKPDEQAWSKAESYGRFVKWAVNDLSYQPDNNESTIKVLRDADYLYFLLRRPMPLPLDDGRMPPLPPDDKFTLYLADADQALGANLEISKKQDIHGSKGIEENVVAAQARNDDAVTWELKVPLANFTDHPADAPMKFNVMDTRAGRYHTLNPTFRQHPSRRSSATLVIE